MKALTLRHPWPFCICHWGKRIENRVWRPKTELRIGDRFAIHGGRPPTTRGNRAYVANLLNDDLVPRFGLLDNGALKQGSGFIGIDRFILPGIVATAVLDSIVTESDDPWFEGPIGWVLRDVIVLPEPIPCKGAQGLWEVPKDVLERIPQ